MNNKHIVISTDDKPIFRSTDSKHIFRSTDMDEIKQMVLNFAKMYKVSNELITYEIINGNVFYFLNTADHKVVIFKDKFY